MKKIWSSMLLTTCTLLSVKAQEPAYTAANNFQNIVKAEYFIDNLTAFGSGKDIPVPSNNGTTLDLSNTIINTSTLSEGFHRLYIRTQDAAGRWSITNQKQFYVFNEPAYAAANTLQPIVKAEYFIDNLTAFGDGIDIPVPSATVTTLDLSNISINTNALPDGFHRLYIRTQDAAGRWSVTSQKQFYVFNEPAYTAANALQNIIKAEYFIDTLTSLSSGTDIPLNSGTTIDLQNLVINFDGILRAGPHQFYIRTMDATGKWSITNNKPFTVLPPPPPPSLSIDPTNVTTFAGSGTAAYANGTGSAAEFYYPNDITIDATGNLYLSSFYNQTMRKITTPGAVVTTFAGGGGNPYYPSQPVDGTGAAAYFIGPTDVETDANDNVYLIDFDPGHTYSVLRKITPAGVVTTLVNGSEVKKGIAVGTDGSLYVGLSDGRFNYKIINVTADTTVFDGGDLRNAPYFSFSKFAIDALGDFYIANTDGNKIFKLSKGTLTTFAGTGTNADNGDGGLATAADITHPQDVDIDALGNVYVSTDNRIRKISPAGYITALAGNNDFPHNIGFADGNGINAIFSTPGGIKINGEGNTLYVADANNHRVRKIAAPVFNPFATITGVASASQYYSVSGVHLTGNAAITASTGYEVSLSENSGYVNSLTFTPQLGDVFSRNIYVRLAAATLPGTYNGNITFSSPGATDKLMPVAGVVTPHQPGGAFNFNGGGYTSMPTNNFPVTNSNYTIEVWIKHSEDRDDNIIRWGSTTSNNTSNGLALLKGNKIDNYSGANNELIVTAPTVNDNNWHHIAATFDGTTRKIFMDGILMGSDIPPAVLNVSAGSSGYIGSYDPYSMQFKGNIDELRIFNKALTQGEIIAKMNCELPTGSANLSAYYKFNQGVAFENNTGITSFTDASANGNTSNIYGYTLNGPLSNFVTGAVVNDYTCTECQAPIVTADGPLTFCQGGSVLLTAAEGSGYLWNNGATTQSISVNSSGDYHATVSNAVTGCSGISQDTHITVNPLPAIPIISASGSLSFCNNNNITLMSSAEAGNKWNTDEIAQNIVVSTAGTFTVTVTDAHGCKAMSLPVITTTIPSSTHTTTVNVCDSYTWSANGQTYTTSGTYSGPTVNCVTEVLNLTITPSSTNTTTANACGSYTWSVNNQTYTASGTYNMVSGCHTERLILTINQSPALFGVTGGGNYCAGTSGTPVGLDGSASGVSYQLKLNGTATGIPLPGTGTAISFGNQTGAGNYTVAATNDLTGCSINMTGTVTVNITSLPTATITSSPATTANLPTGTTVTLTASAGSSYLWSNNATAQIISVTAAGGYSVKVTNSGGCSNTSAAKVVSYGTCTTKPSTPGAISGTADVCTSMTGTTYSISAVSNATLYKWAVPAGCTIISPASVISGINNDTVVTSSTSVTISFASGFVSGIIKVAAINGCGQSGLRSSSTIKKIVAATPGTITADKEILAAICSSQDVTFSITPVLNASGYLWKVPAGCTITDAGAGGTILTSATGDSAVTIGNTSSVIKVRFPATYTSGSVKVQTYRQCLTLEKSGTKSLTVTKVLPSQPAAITGIANTCSNILNNTSSVYTVTPNTNGVIATGYEWTVTGTTAGSVFITETGGVAISPVTSVITTSSVLSIGIKFQNNFTGGTVSVKALRYCQTSSSARSLTLTKNPITPVLTGSNTPCISTVAGVNEYTYAVSSGITGITGFTWTKPANAMLVSGSLTGTSSSLKLRFTSSAAGKVTVKTISACGTSVNATLSTLPLNCGALAKLSTSPVPVAAINDEIKATVYPNPNNGNYHLRFETSNRVDNAEVQIINAIGQIVDELKGININGTIELNVNNSKLVPGLYHLRYQLGHQTGALKMVIQR